METFLDDLSQTGQGLDDARYKKPSYGALEDLGSTLASKKKNGGNRPSSQTSLQSKTSKFKPALASSSKPTKTVIRAKDYTKQCIPPPSTRENVLLSDEPEGVSDESDEMNIRPSSQAGDFEEPCRSQKPVKSLIKKKSDAPAASGGKKSSQDPTYYTDETGKKHIIDPKYNKASSALANLKFKKKQDASTKVTSTSSNDAQFVPKPNLWSSTPSPRKDKDREPLFSSPLSKKSSDSTRPRSPSPSRSLRQKAQPPRPRPKPRPKRAATESSELNLDKPYEKIGDSRPKLVSMIDKVASTSRQTRIRRSESLECSSPKKIRPDEFPMVFSPIREGSTSPVISDTQRTLPASLVPSAFPMPLTPVKTIEKHDAAATVKPDKARHKGKGKAKFDSEDDDGYDTFLSDTSNNNVKQKNERSRKKAGVKVQAFPMSTQMLASISSPSAPSSGSKPSTFESPFSRKRYSDGGSDDGRVSKKSRKGRDLLLESPTRLPWEEGLSINISDNVDPKTLCPYCDTPLPSTLSSLFLKTLEATKSKSVRDPRPSNPLGLKAPLVTFIMVCQRHRFESEILPQAKVKGWPKNIQWSKVSGRVLKMEKALRALIEDPGDDASASEAERESWEVVFQKDGNKKTQGPKERCIFWKEFMNEVKLKGLRAVSGVRGQFENFEKTQPGYYGEIGSVIIHQTLYDMFPLVDMDPDPISPLTPTEFVQRILVPEVALRLIMEDKGLAGDHGMAKAFEILRDSSSYGVAMFPEDGGEWGGKKKQDEEKMGAGDLIVMERARKRRKELEEEEENERKIAEMKAQKELASSKTKKDEERRDTGVSENSLESEKPIARPRPKPRPRKRPQDGTAVTNDILLSSSEMDPGNSSDADRNTRSRSKSILSDRSNKHTNAGHPQSAHVDSRRSPSASESRNFVKESLTRMGSLSLDSESDVSDARNKESRSRASRKLKGKDKAVPSNPQRHSQESNDEEIMIFDHKTPVPRRLQAPDVADEDQTPKAQPVRGGIADILRQRRKADYLQSQQDVKTLDGQKEKRTNGSLTRKDSDTYSWVLPHSEE